MTNLPNAFKDSSNDDAYEASCMCYDWRQDSEHSGPEDAEQQQALSSEPLGEHAAWDLRRHVAVEERRQDDALLARRPVEFTHLSTQSSAIERYNSLHLHGHQIK